MLKKCDTGHKFSAPDFRSLILPKCNVLPFKDLKSRSAPQKNRVDKITRDIS